MIIQETQKLQLKTFSALHFKIKKQMAISGALYFLQLRGNAATETYFMLKASSARCNLSTPVEK